MALTAQFGTGFEQRVKVQTTAAGDGLGRMTGNASGGIVSGIHGLGALNIQPAALAASNLRTITTFTNTISVVRFYMMITSNLNVVGTGRRQAAICGPGATPAAIEVDKNGAVWVTLGANATQGPTLSLNVPYLVELKCDTTSTTRVATMRMNGGTEFSTSATGQTSGAIACEFWLGASDANAGSYAITYDDWICGSASVSTDWWGDGFVEGIVPNGDGTHSFTTGDFSPGDAGATQNPATWTTAYTTVNAPPWTTGRSSTGNIAQRVARSTGYVEVLGGPSGEPTGRTVANAVRATLMYSASGTASDNAAAICRNSDGSSVAVWGDLPVAQGGGGGATQDYSESSNFHKGAYVPVPAATWTPAEVGSCRWRFGGSTDINPIPTLQAVMLEVDWPLPNGLPSGMAMII